MSSTLTDELVHCSTCGADYAVGEWPFCHGDPSAHGIPSGGFIRGNAKKAPETVIFRNAHGEIMIPGSNQDPTPPGFEREEVSGVFATRQLQKRLDQQSRDQREKAQEANEPFLDFKRKRRHEALRQKMKHMSRAGRDFARVAIEKTNSRATGKRYDPGNHVLAYEQNNPKYNDRTTGWKDRG